MAATLRDVESANADLKDPELAGVCDGATLTITSNSIPDYFYIATTPGSPKVSELTVIIPVTPTKADEIETGESLIIGWVADGYPIMSGLVCSDDTCDEVVQLTNSWELTDESLFAPTPGPRTATSKARETSTNVTVASTATDSTATTPQPPSPISSAATTVKYQMTLSTETALQPPAA